MDSLLEKLSRLQAVEAWAVVEAFDHSPDCSLFGGLAVTVGDLEALIPLESQLAVVARFMDRLAKTPPGICAGREDGDDGFI